MTEKAENKRQISKFILEEEADKIGNISLYLASRRSSTYNVAKSLVDVLEPEIKLPFVSFKLWGKNKKEIVQKSLEEKKLELVKELSKAEINPEMFDLIISNEIDRRLKVRFGTVFLILTFLFTTASYSIVVFDGIFKWNISQVAITALIIETPIQFVGLLYIIARNLFPQTEIDSFASEIEPLDKSHKK